MKINNYIRLIFSIIIALIFSIAVFLFYRNKSPNALFLSILLFLILFFLIGLRFLSIIIIRPYFRTFFCKPIVKTGTDELKAAITFDDGPNTNETVKILEILKKYNSKATFFVIGENVKKNPDIIKKMYMEGHELGNHSYNHSILVYKTPGFIKSQIDKTDNLIREAGYKGTIYVRPPKGYKLFFLPWLLKKTGRKLVLWSIMLGDWNNPPPAKMMEELDKKLKPGSIILLHDNIFTDENPMGTTVKLVELMLEKYTKLGYKFVTISQLIE